MKAEEASVELFLRKLSPFPLGSETEPELVLRKPGSRLKITGYKGCGTVAPAHLLQRQEDAQLPSRLSKTLKGKQEPHVQIQLSS